eukprot:4042163-Prymnesium_polylepis.1
MAASILYTCGLSGVGQHKIESLLLLFRRRQAVVFTSKLHTNSGGTRQHGHSSIPRPNERNS